MEAFESFNAIICAKSVHSNHHAPSRDIALAFAQSNRVRHLLSGGHFDIQSFIISNTQGAAIATSNSLAPAPDPTPITIHPPFSNKTDNWKYAGAGPRITNQWALATFQVRHLSVAGG